ncbi:hypothetical protein RJ639_032476 [Escallonia herrerae]|uniref:Glucan endo-1,3-beta-D-glucosidase n=1 Tax=Escallonia herrerae TaxID=1293975 RepID=A0AA89BFB7_9ASTE|nr:hypothetical protein RJ639_032476 [Escallonia herrerae]
MAYARMSLLSIMVIVIYGHIGTMEASNDIGVCYGMIGNNLPSPSDVVSLYKKNGIGKIRLFDPNHAALEALRGSQIDVSLGVLNQDIPSIASSQEAANSWFESNVAPYLNDVTINYISVGNELIPGEYPGFNVPAMQNLQKILDNKGLAGISITTVLSGQTLANSYPPSAAMFSAEAHETVVQVLKFLSAQANPLMINVYPYFAYASDPVNVRLDYAQFTATGPVVVDGSLSYQNLFDAIVDSFFWAMDKEGVTDVELVVSESGWPSAGNGELTTPELAATYNKNFMEHVMKNGTPKRPNSYIEGFIFAMFNENLKPDGVEQNFGLFYPTMNPVYPLFPKQ